MIAQDQRSLFGLEFLTTLLEALFLLYFDYFAPACTIHNSPIQVELGQSEIKFTTCVVDLPSHWRNVVGQTWGLVTITNKSIQNLHSQDKKHLG